MNKKLIYRILLACFLLVGAFIVIRHSWKLKSTEIAFYPILDRQGASAALPEWASTRTLGDKLIRIVRETPDNVKAMLQLAALYIQEGRVTGNYNYYNAAAMKYVGDVLILQPHNFEALILKAIIQLSQHHFAEALQTADVAKEINPYNAFVYGIMVDGNVEMGNYSKAVECSDKMMSIRPDIRSYSRVSYLREIHGDYPGAIEAMKMAVDAGGAGEEATEWARVQLGKLFESTGNERAAMMHYMIAIQERPGYGYGIAGMAHVAMVQGDYPKAISLYTQADSMLNDYAIKEQLAELYRLTGQKAKSEKILNSVIATLVLASKQGDQSFAHHADRELALLYLLKREPGKALDHAQAEYNRRPDNIDVNDVVAWAEYKKADFQNAIPFMKVALRTGCKNPTLLAHAALIYFKVGDAAKYHDYLDQVTKNTAALDPLLIRELQVITNK